jgi:hypothetical protein
MRTQVNDQSVCEREARWNYSQHYFAELRGEEVLEHIRVVANGKRARAILDAQIADEKNHAEIYRGISSRLGLASEAVGYSEAYSQYVMNLRTLPEKVFAFQVLTESTAHAYISWRLAAVRDRELNAVDRAVLADEARHLDMASALLRICQPDEIEEYLTPQTRAKLTRDVLTFGLDSFRASVKFCLGDLPSPLSWTEPTDLERLVTRTVIAEARRQTNLLQTVGSGND